MVAANSGCDWIHPPLKDSFVGTAGLRFDVDWQTVAKPSHGRVKLT
jgi:hypothetical protein